MTKQFQMDHKRPSITQEMVASIVTAQKKEIAERHRPLREDLVAIIDSALQLIAEEDQLFNDNTKCIEWRY